MRKILLATDFSEAGVRAGEIARDLAKRAGCTLVLLHVVEPPRLPAELPFDVTELMRSLNEAAQTSLRAAADELRAQGLTVEERVEAGFAAERIPAIARDIGARAIVMGTHGRRGVAHFLLGSVAQRTLLNADRPVIVARGGGEPHGMDEWVKGTRPLQVTLAVDRSPGTSAAVAWVRWLRELGPVDVRLLHAGDPVVEAEGLGLAGGRGSAAAAVEKELLAFVGEIPGAGRLSFALRASRERPGQVVAHVADEHHADLLVLGTHQKTGAQRFWLGSTAELALRLAHVPVACVPAVSRAAVEDPGRADEVC